MPTQETNPALYKRVLIADDDSFVRGSLAAVLESEGERLSSSAAGSALISVFARSAREASAERVIAGAPSERGCTRARATSIELPCLRKLQ